MINIDFEKTDGTYTLHDALRLPDDHNLSDDEIEEIKQKRFDDWIAFINIPTPVVEPILAECLVHPDYVEYDGIRYIKSEV